MPAGATQCANCGALIPKPTPRTEPAPGQRAECPECGEAVPTGLAECPACGHRFAAKAAPPAPAREQAHLLEELEWAIAGEVAKPPPPLLPEIPPEVLKEKKALLNMIARIPGVGRAAAESVAEFFQNVEQIAMTEGDEVRALPGMTAAEADRILQAVQRLVAEREARRPAPAAPAAGPRAEPRRETRREPGFLRSPPVVVARDLAAVATVAALPVAVAASFANVAGHEWGELFLFGVLFGLAAALTVPALRAARGPGRRMDRIASLAWTAGLLLLTILAALPLLSVSPGAVGPVLGFLGGIIAFGAALFMTVRRVLRYAAEAHLLRADEAHAKRDFAAAIASYDRAIALSRLSGWGASAAWTGKGATLVAAGRFAEAVELLDRALAASPENEVAWINKGTALSRLGRMNEALRCYNAAIKANAAYEVAWNNKGNALARLGKHDLALQCYGRALELDPAFRTAWVNKGFVLTRLGRFREAAECANEAIRLTTGVAAT